MRCRIASIWERIVNSMPMRPNLALFALFPRVMERVTLMLGVHKTMQTNATHGKG